MTTTTQLSTTPLTTTTAASKPKTSILILNTRNDNIPVITDSNGKAEYSGKDFDFDFGDETQVQDCCSVTYRGHFYVFGGYNFKKQISKLEGCSLQRIGSLDFDFYLGGCATVNEESIYLCFDEDDSKRCHFGSDPIGTFSSVIKSQFSHTYTRIAASEGYCLDLNLC